MSNIAYETIFAIVETHTERIDEKKKKKSLLNQQCKREFAPTFTLFEEGKGSRCTFLSSSLLSHLSRNAFEILFHKTEKKKLDYLEGNRSAMFRETVENHRFND